MTYIEMIIGALAGIFLFLNFQGIDVIPMLFLSIIVGVVLYFNPAASLRRKSFTSSSTDSIKPISFDDIGGQEIAKNELREALAFMKKTEQTKLLGIRPLKGILLSGPPGTGKTLLAKAAAHYTNSVFLSASGSEFVEMYVGVGAQRVRQLFTQARSMAKRLNKDGAVIFIDEMEIMGGKRGQTNSHTEHDQTLNELLVQMDGINDAETTRILVIGATNRLDMLDPAILRPGRFDRMVKVDLPDKKGRLHILELHTKNKPLSIDVCLSDLAKDTFGFSGAQLESTANEAAILAMREGSEEINAQHFRSAIEKVMMGEKLDKRPTKDEQVRIAVHEAGHALVSELLQPGSVASVNVASRSNALGYVRQTQEDDMYLYTHEYLKGRITVALAGSVAEDVILNSRSTGASNDFKQAADFAKVIIASGMSELGIVSPEDIPKDVMHKTISAILADIENHTREIITKYQSTLSAVTTSLLDNETLSGIELRTLLQTA